MHFDPRQMDPTNIYKLLTGLVVPRPIGFVSTLNPAGVNNLAPFSFFNVITPSPPHLVLSVGERAGQVKDTIANLEHLGELVVNIVTREIVERMNITSGDWPPDASEFELSGLTPIASDLVRPMRVAESPANMECVLRQLIPVGGPPYGAHLVIAEVVRFHVKDDYLLPRGRIDLHKLHAVGRLAGDWYCASDDQFELKRPVVGEIHSFGVGEHGED